MRPEMSLLWKNVKLTTAQCYRSKRKILCHSLTPKQSKRLRVLNPTKSKLQFCYSYWASLGIIKFFFSEEYLGIMIVQAERIYLFEKLIDS